MTNWLLPVCGSWSPPHWLSPHGGVQWALCCGRYRKFGNPRAEWEAKGGQGGWGPCSSRTSLMGPPSRPFPWEALSPTPPHAILISQPHSCPRSDKERADGRLPVYHMPDTVGLAHSTSQDTILPFGDLPPSQDRADSVGRQLPLDQAKAGWGQMPRFRPQLCYLTVVWPWESH